MRILKIPLDPNYFETRGQAYIDYLVGLLENAAGNLKKKLQTAPPYKHVRWIENPRSTGIPGGFHSERQRRYVLYKMDEKNKGGDWSKSPPYYRRTGAMAKSWVQKTKRGGDQISVQVRHDQRFHRGKGEYVQSEKLQHWRMEMLGWPTVNGVIAKYWKPERDEIIRKANAWRAP